MTANDLTVGSKIQTLGYTYTIMDIQTHPKFGLELLVKVGKQTATLWRSAGMVNTWLKDAVMVEILLFSEETDR